MNSDKTLTTDEIRSTVFAALYEVAPELSDEELVADEALRDQADLDSMDWLNFLIGVKKALGVDIPESDYSALRTIDDIVEYVARHR
ncbi:acyl carrier protein [Gordonia sp. HNM0687]|uniref:Acyl carrier protein n=1 Tax=Gordonia mangrovi TaxID=2665643 RepID=A0A6L7GRW2_9ACTN|nr:acyl carrier protein [Gordonia mangrovi]MXP22313.1 acyl carrier protein [Gordonia mangrovi]UVF77792.1 acyl carrier protein [Gordonia mangrovi]